MAESALEVKISQGKLYTRGDLLTICGSNLIVSPRFMSHSKRGLKAHIFCGKLTNKLSLCPLLQGQRCLLIQIRKKCLLDWERLPEKKYIFHRAVPPNEPRPGSCMSCKDVYLNASCLQTTARMQILSAVLKQDKILRARSLVLVWG